MRDSLKYLPTEVKTSGFDFILTRRLNFGAQWIAENAAEIGSSEKRRDVMSGWRNHQLKRKYMTSDLPCICINYENMSK